MAPLSASTARKLSPKRVKMVLYALYMALNECTSPFAVDVEGIGVLHDKFPGSHHPKARANLVSKLGLNLVVIDGQLFVALNIAAGRYR